MDMITVYIAGYDPTSHALVSIIFNIKKNKSVYTNIQEELKNNFILNKNSNLNEKEKVRQMIDSLDFLSMTIKESLRHSNPAFFSLGYKAIENVTIWGVPIPKGATIFQCLHAIHYDPQEWKDPMKFIPERFDPESEYFTPPKAGNFNQRNISTNYIPFSTGLRKWPGMNLAMLELKLITAKFISTFAYELDPQQEQNEYIRFTLRSQHKWKIKIISEII